MATMATVRRMTEVIKVEAHDPDPLALARAAEVLRGGGLVVLPTDTVYGLVCDPRQAAAVDRLYEVKQRSRDLPLVLLLHDMAQVESFIGAVPEKAVRAMQEFWPGALTVVLRDCSPETEPLRACQESIGLRLPAHLVPKLVAQHTGGALASSSANVSGGLSPTTAEEAVAQLDGLVQVVLDAGPTKFARESTVVSFIEEPPVVLREGAITVARLREVLGEVRTK
jgi:L-threonylcarbamoyladenylate synthase